MAAASGLVMVPTARRFSRSAAASAAVMVECSLTPSLSAKGAVSGAPLSPKQWLACASGASGASGASEAFRGAWPSAEASHEAEASPRSPLKRAHGSYGSWSALSAEDSCALGRKALEEALGGAALSALFGHRARPKAKLE